MSVVECSRACPSLSRCVGNMQEYTYETVSTRVASQYLCHGCVIRVCACFFVRIYLCRVHVNAVRICRSLPVYHAKCGWKESLDWQFTHTLSEPFESAVAHAQTSIFVIQMHTHNYSLSELFSPSLARAQTFPVTVHTHTRTLTHTPTRLRTRQSVGSKMVQTPLNPTTTPTITPENICDITTADGIWYLEQVSFLSSLRIPSHEGISIPVYLCAKF